MSRKQINHLIQVNFMGIADKIKNFKKTKRQKAVTTANKYK